MISWGDKTWLIALIVTDEGDHASLSIVLCHENEVRIAQGELHANVGAEQSESYLSYSLFFYGFFHVIPAILQAFACILSACSQVEQRV